MSTLNKKMCANLQYLSSKQINPFILPSPHIQTSTENSKEKTMVVITCRHFILLINLEGGVWPAGSEARSVQFSVYSVGQGELDLGVLWISKVE